MSPQQTVDLARSTLETAMLIAAPLLVIATVVSLVVNIAQVLTSLQEQTLSTVPRLTAVAAVIFLLMPWMVRRMTVFTVQMFSDFHPYLR
ncbi:MAG TPA: flagellar biosynthetic protein FliQ [Acidobacteriaceae bacterium]|nr:flagellar biosynthetic protein FliQ [Acidobacteriaceae bacterium]